MILGLCGQAGSGKDTVADFLVKNHGFVKVAFADPLKRICKDVFDFSDEQLWGPSQMRDAPDKRYFLGRNLDQDEYRDMYLTPRYALQTLGTEWGRWCYSPIWVEYAMRVANRIQNYGGHYDPRKGLTPLTQAEREDYTPPVGVVIPDVRFKNEIDAIHKLKGRVIRIMRKNREHSAVAAQHVSESGQNELGADLFDHHLINGGNSLNLLEAATTGLYETIFHA